MLLFACLSGLCQYFLHGRQAKAVHLPGFEGNSDEPVTQSFKIGTIPDQDFIIQHQPGEIRGVHGPGQFQEQEIGRSRVNRYGFSLPKYI